MADDKGKTPEVSAADGGEKVIEYTANADIYTQLTGSVRAGSTVKFKADDPDAKALLAAHKISPLRDPEENLPDASTPTATTRRSTPSTPTPPPPAA